MADPIAGSPVHAGQAVYTRHLLSVYDLWVLGISNRFIWRCPTPHLLKFHNSHVTDNHLDIGVGTGYFLDRCTFPSQSVRLGLMDLNQNSLDYTAERIRRYSPEQYRHNVFEPFPVQMTPFDSVSLNFLLHCLPGSMPQKGVVFENCRAILKDGGTLFGTTIICDEQRTSWLAKKIMKVYNRKRIFGNACDSLETLTAELSAGFADVQITVRGCVAMFSGKRAARES